MKVGIIIMDVSAITSVISNLGFPIAVAIALFWKMNQQDEKQSNDLEKLSEVIQNNTNVLTQLCERLKGDNRYE